MQLGTLSRKEHEQSQKKSLIVELETPQKQKAPREKRIVQTSPGERVDKAPENAFLGRQNQRVDQETMSRHSSVATGEAQPRKKQRNLNKVDLSKLGVRMPPVLPKTDEPAWVSPGTRPQDYVDHIAESNRTALNTREYVFYGYFQRIKQQLDRAWHPILRDKLISFYRSGRQLASDMDHVTQVMVILNRQGEIVRVQILTESGFQDLDDAAIGAFNRAGPFPNPPKGIIDSNNEVKIPWDFILKT